MSSSPSNPSAKLPYPLLVNALTGTATPPAPLENFTGLTADLPNAGLRSQSQVTLGLDPDAGDPNELNQTGWGIVFASDADPAIQAQLQPLIKLREGQVQAPAPFEIYSGDRGVGPGQSVEDWMRDRGAPLNAQVNPFENGVPYYILIVGSPERISFEFQAKLKMQWAVGRLYFDDIQDYGRYAQAVAQYESTAFSPTQARNSALWVTRNVGDIATAMLSGAISDEFLPPDTQLGKQCNFMMSAFVNEKATKAQLIEILRGNVPGGPPAVIFTGSHGCDYSGADPVKQRRLQGALATQEWVPNAPADSTNQFSADDIPADAKLLGTVGFLFACYSGACPAQNNYYLNKDGSPIQVAPAPMISLLPQKMLSRGMLAVIAHTDLAFPYSFQDVDGTPDMRPIRSPLEQIMGGRLGKARRVGLAADFLTTLWTSRAAGLSFPSVQAPAAGTIASPAPATAASPQLAQMIIARDDARNYIVLGDPAAQLRTGDLK